MKKILISDPIDKNCISILQSYGYSVLYKPGMTPEQISTEIGEYNALIVRSETKVNAAMISKMSSMEIIGRAGTGVDNIDVETSTRHGIIVMNTPGGNTISAAEHTMALMLSMCRNVPQANMSIREHKWERKKYQGTELSGKVLGVIGLGKIGREVATRSKAFGMKIIGYDPLLSSETASKYGIELKDLDSLFATSDIITLHVPLSAETKYLISSENLKKCKQGVKIINCARGGIINEEELVDALDFGKVSAAALDVFEKEPPDFSQRIFNHPKVICTPHLGASTEEAQEKVAVQIAEQIHEFFESKKMYGVVNAVGLEALSKKEILPYVTLAENIGKIYAQMIRYPLKQINIYFSGEMLQSSSSVLSSAVLKGLLSTLLTEHVNIVNSKILAKEMGVKVNETNSEENSNYLNLLSVEFLTDSERKYFAGTVFGNNEIRIVRIDDYFLEVKPEGYLLFYTNIDKPGMLAAVGQILSDAKINIAGLSLGRLEEGKEALSVMNVDNQIDEKVLSKISMINGVTKVHSVRI
ncbi:MAG: phosphoglycerate dehydrogenase [Ignavibacteriaceae bacterium]|nr:phosphoglycerate dehydrogenase [Ignavibacteriaceae bacterium]